MADPIRRIRDQVRYRKPQQIVSAEEWDEIVTKYAAASEFLKPTNLIYVTMVSSLKQAEDTILENRLREVHEEHSVTEAFKKIFITPKKLQDDEMVGQIKYIRSFLAEMKSWIDFKEVLEQKEADGVIKIERSKDDRH
jgi:hypothetical protein